VVLDALVADIALAAPGGARTALLVDGPARFCANDAARPLGGAMLTWRLYAARGWKARPLTARLPFDWGRTYAGGPQARCQAHTVCIDNCAAAALQCAGNAGPHSALPYRASWAEAPEVCCISCGGGCNPSMCAAPRDQACLQIRR